MKKNLTLRKLTTVSMLTALAVIFGYFAFPIFPNVAFLEYDICDVFILTISFIFGPVYGCMASAIVALFQAFLLDKSGIFGLLMNIVSTMSFVLSASLIYRKFKTKKGAVVSLLTGTVVATTVMIGFNYVVTPYFMGVPVSVVHSLILFIAAFNLIKYVANSTITFFAYKHISKLIKKFN